MPSEIKARLRYFNLLGCMFYEFGTVGQAGRAAFRTFETGGTVAAVGCCREKLLPANLHPHFQTACIEDGRLVLLAANNMAASRLKMIAPSVLPQLAGLDASIRSVSVRLVKTGKTAENQYPAFE